MSDSVQLELSGGIATIILARPEKLNALDDGMIELLGRHADMIDAEYRTNQGSFRARIRADQSWPEPRKYECPRW
jgi:enoyl-CoA hydratase/carnithine racemase